MCKPFVGPTPIILETMCGHCYVGLGFSSCEHDENGIMDPGPISDIGIERNLKVICFRVLGLQEAFDCTAITSSF